MLAAVTVATACVLEGSVTQGIAAVPRGSVKKSTALREQGLPAGDCVECLQCVHVCPTGVDIREGPNLGCIQCGLCIDACDAVMAKTGRPARLIAYDTDVNIHLRQDNKVPIYKIVRLRTELPKEARG